MLLLSDRFKYNDFINKYNNIFTITNLVTPKHSTSFTADGFIVPAE